MARHGVLSVKLNQDQEYFTVATENGLQIYHIDPLVKTNSVDATKVGSIRCSTMLFRTNIVGLVSGGRQPMHDERTVILWDLHKESAIMKVVLKEPVLDVQMAKERLILVLRSRIILLSFPQGETLAEIETWDNPNGLCAVSQFGRKMAFPAKKSRGCIQIEDLGKDDHATESKPPVIIQAHGNDIVCAAINHTGNLLATASSQGTNIHLYNCEANDVSLRTRLRRGLDKANIYCLNFSKDGMYLCCSSDKGTVHIWSVREEDIIPVSKLKPLVGLPVEAKSYASFTVTAECACICCFGPGDAIYAICLDGSFHKYKIGRDGSQIDTGKNCFRVAYDIYPNLGEMFE